MAAFGTFDYGQAIGAGTQNALAQVQFMQQANQLAQQQKAAETAGQLPALRQQAIAGGTPYQNPALDILAAKFPDDAKAVQELLSKGNEAQRKAFSDANKMIGQIAFQIDPNDPAAPQRWDAGVDFLANQGIDISRYKGQYSPQLRDQALAISGLTEKVMSSYGQPQTVMGPEGLELAQFSSYAGAPPKAVEGYVPLPPKKGIKFTTPEGAVIEIGGTPDEEAEMAQADKLKKAEVILGKVDEALGQIGFFNTGFIGGITQAIPGTPAYDLEKTVTTIKANLGFQELQTMRDMSPTGGALGNITEKEIDFLQSLVASMDIGQSRPQLIKNLEQVRDQYLKVMALLEVAQEQQKQVQQTRPKPPAAPAAPQAPAPTTTTIPIGTVDNGYEYVGGDVSSSNSWRKVK